MAESGSLPSDWTLRFKNHNVTILLNLPPTESFETIKGKLLNALKARDIKEINGVQVPEAASQLELGLPIDRNNLDKGWTLIQPAAGTTGSKRNANGTKKKSTEDTPQGADMRDSQAVAFRFRNEEDTDMDADDSIWDVLISSYDDDDEGEEG